MWGVRDRRANGGMDPRVLEEMKMKTGFGLYATDPIEKGEQIYINYKSDMQIDDYLSEYGFLPVEMVEPTVFSFTLVLNSNDPMLEKKQSILKNFMISTSAHDTDGTLKTQWFPCTSSHFLDHCHLNIFEKEMLDVNGMTILRVALFNEEEQLDMLDYAYQQHIDGNIMMPLGIKNELQVVE